MRKIKDYSLYLVVSQEYAKGKGSLGIVEEAVRVKGGVDIVQMREKHMLKNELIDLGRKIASICRDSGVVFIVNDDPVVAVESGADGVHLGQEDAARHNLSKVRALLGKESIIGISTHNIEQFEEANNSEADYIAFGPVFPTKTKDYFIGTKDIRNVLEIADKPVIFIGGINLSNIGLILQEGARNIALIRDIVQADDIAGRVMLFKEKLNAEKNKQKMIIRLNGKNQEVQKSYNLVDLVGARGFSAERIVIEHNRRIVPKEEWPAVSLQDNDIIEIVSFVAGG